MANRFFDEHIESFPPGYFALVMATGIVSIAAYLLGMEWVGQALLVFNVCAYVILWALNLVRLVRYPRALFDDLFDHRRGPGFFTVVAGTCVLGNQMLVVAGNAAAAWVLWWFGVGLWVLIIYGFFTAVTIVDDKPPLAEGLDGTWLIAIVATQSVSILGTFLAAGVGEVAHIQLFFALSLFFVGCLLYIPVITMILYRFTFLPLESRGLTPPYWINMGATAITTLAGASLILAAPEWPFLQVIGPFLKGFTLLFWAFGTWWIPLLIILGIWRHLIRRYPLSYNAQYWGMVFPLGMYTACTLRLSDALELEILAQIPRYFVWVALSAWVLVTLGLVVAIVQLASSRSEAPG